MNNKIGGDKITFTYRYKKQILVGIITVIIISIIIFFIIMKTPEKENEIIIEEPQITNKKKVKKEEKKELYKVDIKGEVNNPGIYTLTASSRIIDVIEAASGLTENANTSVINLSKKITDEMVIIIYSNKQVNEFEKTKEIEKQVQEKCQQPNENALTNDACISQEKNSSDNQKISINNATLEELMTLSGIGESKAKDIIEYRNANGPFQKIEDLMEIPGIGESIFAKIKENITL